MGDVALWKLAELFQGGRPAIILVANLLLFESGTRISAPPFQHCNANKLLLRPYSSTLFIISYHHNLTSGLVDTRSHSVFVRQFSTSTPDVVTDSDNDDNWVSKANGSATKSQNFVIRSLHAACTNILHIGHFLVSAPFMSRFEFLMTLFCFSIVVTFYFLASLISSYLGCSVA